jgi:hypothetical protein
LYNKPNYLPCQALGFSTVRTAKWLLQIKENIRSRRQAKNIGIFRGIGTPNKYFLACVVNEKNKNKVSANFFENTY